MLAAAPYNSRKYGTLYAMEDACQTSAGEIILRITWNHCVNIGNDYLVNGWICLWFWCVFSKVNGFIRLEIFADDRLQSFGSFVIWFDGCTGLWWVHGNWCETAEHIFQLKWITFIRNNILCAGSMKCWAHLIYLIVFLFFDTRVKQIECCVKLNRTEISGCQYTKTKIEKFNRNIWSLRSAIFYGI